MENYEKIEKYANDNLQLATHEKDLALNSKKLANSELKKAKARDALNKQEIAIAKIREDLAEKLKKIINLKLDKKVDLNLNEKNIKIEKDIALTQEKLAKSQVKIAEIKRRISNMEKEIAQERIQSSEKRLKIAYIQNDLSKKQFAYVKLAKSGALDDKLNNAEKKYIELRKDLASAREEFVKKAEDVKKKEDELANIKKELVEALTAEEKIMHASV